MEYVLLIVRLREVLLLLLMGKLKEDHNGWKVKKMVLESLLNIWIMDFKKELLGHIFLTIKIQILQVLLKKYQHLAGFIVLLSYPKINQKQ